MNLFRSAATVGGYTLISRVLGFVRDVLIAALLGTGPVADAFVVAFRFPNLFRRLFGEGAFNAAFVPLFAKRLEEEGREGARAFGEQVFAVLLAALLVLTIFAELFMPWLMVVIAPGFVEEDDKYDLAVFLTRIAFPYLLFMSLVAMLSGVLNSFGRFAAAAAAPIILNVVLISVLSIAAYMLWGNTAKTGVILAWGVSLAGALQFIMLIVACYRAGITFGFRRPRLTPDVKRLVRLGIPGVIAGGITQINIVIGTIIASLQAGAVSYLYYADRVYQLPLGVVGIAIGIVLLPDLSRRLGAGDDDGAAASQNRALEYSMLLTVPAAVALVAMPQPVVQVLFERGAFGAADTEATAWALAAFALGLPSFVMIKVFSPSYFAREDTRTPMIYAGAGMIANVVGSLILFWQIGHVGIALASSVAGWLNAGLLWYTLARRGQYTPDLRLVRRLPRILFSSLVMGTAVWAGAEYAAYIFTSDVALVVRIAVLAGLVALGAVVYFATANFIGAARVTELREQFRRS